MQQAMETYMVKSPYVVEPGESVAGALLILKECGVRHLPVVDAGRLIGVISDRDLREANALPQSSELSVGDVMKRDVFVAHRRDPLKEVVRTMHARKIGSTVVVNERREVIGIFTTTDAMEILADMLEDGGEDVLSIDDYIDPWEHTVSALS